MSDLKTVPKPHVANKSTIADFAEIECLRKEDGNVSSLDITRILLREAESIGDDAVRQIVDEAFQELTIRSEHCGADGRYPYEIRGNGGLLARRSGPAADKSPADLLYWYLLLSTQMNMKTNRNQGGHDGTALFEHLCQEVAIRFWGGPSPNVGAIVFGTGRQTNDLHDDAELGEGVFQSAIDKLCAALGEGTGFLRKPESAVHARDGKLDVVVWRRFSDKRPGQLIGFGQCKTGKYWDKDLMKLQPEGFCAKWLQKRPAVLPVRLYFIADRVIDDWYDRCVDGGIVFDRCRIVDHATNLSPALIQQIGVWVKAAAGSEGLLLS